MPSVSLSASFVLGIFLFFSLLMLILIPRPETENDYAALEDYHEKTTESKLHIQNTNRQRMYSSKDKVETVCYVMLKKASTQMSEKKKPKQS